MGEAGASHLILVGLMGSGKTTVGRACAARLDRALVDTDDLITAAAGVDIPEIFVSEGEDGFRARERTAVADACATPDPAVIACGGGAVLDADNRGRLETAGWVVWLQASPRMLAARVDGGGRPLLWDRPAGVALEALAEVRAPAYEAVADATVTTDGKTVDEVCDAVLAAYAERESVGR